MPMPRTAFCLAVTVLLMTIAIPAARATQPLNFADLLARARPAADQRLAYGAEPDQFVELWLPTGSDGPYPVVALIHGGCWLASLPGLELMDYLAGDLRRHGVAVWNIEYRRLGTDGAGYPGTFLDIADGMDYLRKIAATDKLDLSHLVVIGHSAGGQLALWAAARGHLKSGGPLYRPDPLPVRGVITLAGINDLTAYRQNGPDACGGPATIDGLIGAGRRINQNVYADTSPAAILPLGVTQLIVSGALDPIVPALFGKNYAAAAKTAGDPADSLVVDKAGHFDLIDPDSAGWTRVRSLLLSQFK